MASETFVHSDILCVICNTILRGSGTSGYDTVVDLVTLTAKGLASLQECSVWRGDQRLTNYLLSRPPTVRAHVECRKRYTNKRSCYTKVNTCGLKSDEPPSKVLRSCTIFEWKRDCFLCCKPAVVDKRHPGGSNIRVVGTLVIRENVLKICCNRNDEWSVSVKGRLEGCCDLVAEEAVYHATCYMRFSRSRPMEAVGGFIGRIEDELKLEPFNRMCEWLESAGDELCSVEDLVSLMKDFGFDEKDVYSSKHLKRKLMEKYGDHIFFTNVPGHRNVVCFRDMASTILDEKWYSDRNSNIEEESSRVVKAAAKLLKDSIRKAMFTMDEYPVDATVGDVSCLRDWMPPLLQEFMSTLLTSELKQVSIGHAVVQACRPKSCISPLLFGVGTSIDHVYGGKWLITMLSRLGYSVSSDEVTRFKQCTVRNDSSSELLSSDHCFTQWSGDNIDHNVITVDGKGSFHGMGIISMSTLYSASAVPPGDFGEVSVQRLKRISAADVVRGRGIPIIQYCEPPTSALSTLSFKPILHLSHPYTLPPELNFDIIWHTALFFRPDLARVNWSGFMQSISVGDHTPPAKIEMLPIIDLNPSDAACIFSTLSFVQAQAKKLNIKPCITFDQPLYQKAVDISETSKLDIVCRLGGFHLLMSFMGSIGTVMEGSGLSEVLESCYGSNTVNHMMTGKAYARAIRGHILVESALYSLLLGNMVEFLHEDTDAGCLDAAALIDLYEAVASGQCDEAVLDESKVFRGLLHALNNYKKILSSTSRTAKLWLQYMNYVELLRMFIRAERTGNWNLHLITVQKMLNLFAATGHNNYTKCGRLYLQLMHQLPDKHPWLYDKFMAGGFHSVRRSDRLWAGLSTDLVIEQVMMKAIKSKGGLTHGRGMTESVRATWVGSMHRCAGVLAAVTKLVDAEHLSHDIQHVDLGKARIDRDNMDIMKLLDWLKASNPFSLEDCRLRSLSSGVAASVDDDINCDEAEVVGSDILLRMDNIPFTDVVMKKSMQVKTISKLTDKAATFGKHSQLDSGVLFNRLLVILQRNDDIAGYFTHELTPMPSALFKGMSMRKCDKSQLRHHLTKGVMSSDCSMDTKYVLDGGALLHRVKWQEEGTYGDVIKQYLSYVSKHYGGFESVIVVFDGYDNGPSTKDVEHERRAMKCAPNVAFDDNIPAYRNQSSFLTNDSNKKQFVFALICHFEKAGYRTKQAVNDADCLIVQTALDVAQGLDPVTVVADDADILVMLVHHYKDGMADIYLLSEASKRAGKRPSNVSIRDVCSSIGSKAVSQILVIHAISGCDTTSAMFGHGKSTVFRKITASDESQVLTDTIASRSSTRQDIINAGLKLVSMMYGGKTSDSLNRMRYLMYVHLTATGNNQVRPERLPPTENAAKYHIMRAHFQVTQWKMDPDINPEEWGWQLLHGKCLPTATDLEPAPEDILKVVRCKCKREARRPCSSTICSCRKHGLHCVSACKHCNGEICDNQCHDISSSTSFVDDGMPLDLDDVGQKHGETIGGEYVDYELPYDLYEEIVH